MYWRSARGGTEKGPGHAPHGQPGVDRRRAGAPADRKGVVKRVAAVAVAGLAVYLVAPKLASVLGAWPRLATLNPVWCTVALTAEVASVTCNFALQRVALQTSGWFAVVTAGLSSNAVTDSLPGSEAAGARRPVPHAHHRRVRPQHRRRRPHRVFADRRGRPARAARIRTARHRGRRAREPRSGAHRCARPGLRSPASRSSARSSCGPTGRWPRPGAAAERDAQLGHPGSPAAGPGLGRGPDRASGTRCGAALGRKWWQAALLTAGRLGFDYELPARRPARRRSQPAPVPGAAGLLRGRDRRR